jgi:coenzyme F420-reducing hydrogenase delta subunit
MADEAGRMRLCYSEGVRIVPVPCIGRVSVLHILKAFEYGAEGVLVLGCPEEGCHHISGSTRAKEKVAEASALLTEIGLDGERVQIFTPNSTPELVRIISEASEKIGALGLTV